MDFIIRRRSSVARSWGGRWKEMKWRKSNIFIIKFTIRFVRANTHARGRASVIPINVLPICVCVYRCRRTRIRVHVPSIYNCCDEETGCECGLQWLTYTISTAVSGWFRYWFDVMCISSPLQAIALRCKPSSLSNVVYSSWIRVVCEPYTTLRTLPSLFLAACASRICECRHLTSAFSFVLFFFISTFFYFHLLPKRPSPQTVCVCTRCSDTRTMDRNDDVTESCSNSDLLHSIRSHLGERQEHNENICQHFMSVSLSRSFVFREIFCYFLHHFFLISFCSFVLRLHLF